MIQTYINSSERCSKYITTAYSTSFSSAIRMLHPSMRSPIYNIYAFVRVADEIVDTFLQHDRATLLEEFIAQTKESIERGISTNPVLQSFQATVQAYKIPYHLIEAFFDSMRMDLHKEKYTKATYNTYIYGSAEVVGLMCLCVFVEGNTAQYETLRPCAQSLGAAFQKINFLRDLHADYLHLDRSYFPNVDFTKFSIKDKRDIENEIAHDFDAALEGIKRLPWKVRFGVYVAYKYYLSLFAKIKKVQPEAILQSRVRVPDYYKAYILLRASVKNQLRLI